MSLSPAQRHNQRIAMEQKLKQSLAVGTTESMHLLIKALETDVEQVRSLPLIADRIEHKRNVLLPKWVPTVEAYLASGQVYANPVLAWCVIWLFDVGDLDKALEWGRYRYYSATGHTGTAAQQFSNVRGRYDAGLGGGVCGARGKH
ncbi:phage terminase subunit [Enterobacter cloacae]|uniref:Phage terminase subunit n=1 Tax=Enterobacter cloacae TaxID=550 RepID=A0A377M5U8_ENTCL|nr:phage terminase subunit [Enterobacter cloacae]